MSSAWEGMSIVLVEALALSPRLISTDCPYGPREILQDGKYGKLVGVGDYGALAGAMNEALDEKPFRCDAYALDRFRVEHVIQQYLNILFE